MTEAPAHEDEVFKMRRTFDAPPELIWAMWTQKDHLEQWFGPAGMTLVVKSLDLTPGGVFIYGMEVAGMVMWGKWVFREIQPTSRLSYVLSFCNEAGQPVRHPMAPTWPLQMLCEQNFSPSEDGKTLFESRSWPIHATAEERAVFKLGHASMTAGFGGTFAKLETYLKQVQGG
ncbi:SRPBCC family protein [Asticcacaulis biprosthecium]|uniref:SRPBCC family protein n=1 Tax=Asticcacaulis biprosthecium TaxID=76891 RepID=UPI0003023460|nr:SRPBCC domain-containing protein [Asticcacaulis biprosthecium]